MDKNNKPLNVRLKGNEQKKSSIKKASPSKSITKKHNASKKGNTPEEKTKKKKGNKKIGWKIFRVLLFIGIAFCIVCAGIVLGVISGIIDDTESISLDELELLPQTSFIYDKDGAEIGSLYDSENRIMVTFDDIPKYTVNAVVAIEDERFFSHHGIDIKRTIGAVGTYVINGGESDYGASTLTQQLVKNISKDDERAWQRKIREWYRAISLETKLSKEQIFESYVNTIYYGDGSYGIEVASNHFFGKSVSELNLAESAAIAAMIQSPEITNPYRNDTAREALINRKNVVLNKMLSLGMISQEEHDQATTTELTFKSRDVGYGGTQTYFVDAVVEAVIKDLMEQKNVSRGIALKMIYTDGYKIYTTQDQAVQRAVDNAFANPNIFYYDWDGGFMQGAMVVLDHTTGEVRGLIGGADEKVGSLTLNRATQTHRQPGSCMKPFGAYGPAFELGILNPGATLDDSAFSMGNWSPHNWYGYYYGYVTVRDAIMYSMNIPAVKANLSVQNEDYCWNFAYNCGLTSLVEQDKNAASLGLGGVTNGFTVMQMANAYGTIANGGVNCEPRIYTKVEDRNGNIVLDNTTVKSKVAMKETTAYMLTSCLVSVTSGTSPLGFQGTGVGAVKIKGGAIECAGKTGNTNDDFDRWFCGATPYYTIACWTGYDVNQPINRGYPYPSTMLFNTVMNWITEDKPAANFAVPSNITRTEVCRDSGKVPTDACRADQRGSRASNDLIATEGVSTDTCDIHKFVTVCSESGKLPGPNCPTTSRSFITRSVNTAGASDSQYVVPTETCTNTHTPKPNKVVIYRNGVAQ